MTVSGFQSQAMRKYITKNTSASVESAPTSQSLAERAYKRIGTIANVMRPTAANQIRTCVLNSLMTSGRPLTHLKHLHEVKGRNRRIANLQSSHQNPMMCGFSVLTFRLTIWLPDWRNKRLTPVNSPSHQSKSYQNPSGAPSVRTSYAFSCLGIFWSKTVAFMSARFRTYSIVPASRKPDSPASASASLIPFTSIRGAFSGVT